MSKKIKNLQLIKDSLSVLLSAGNHNLRNRQYEALLKLASSSNEELYQGYFNHPTGGGKTLLMAKLLKALGCSNQTQKIIILEQSLNKISDLRENLTNPDRVEYIEEDLENIGVFNKDKKDVDKKIIIATYASLKNLITQIDVANVGLVIADEAHHGLSEMRRHALSVFENACVYGFTATKEYDEVKSLDNLLFNQIDELSVAESIARGNNCSMKNILLVSDVDVDLTTVKKSTNGEYDEKEFNKAISFAHKNGITEQIVEYWSKFVDEETGEKAKDRMTMINCHSLEQAKQQAEAFNNHFGKVVAKPYGSYLSEKERADVLRGFETGEFPVICQVATIGEAYNNQELSLCINYPTSSIVRAAQRGGRTLRLDPNNPNKKAWIVDVVFRHPDYVDAPVTVAAEKNGQILYAHIAGALDITSASRKTFEKTLSSQRGALPKASSVNLLNFTVCSSTQELMKIENETLKWEKNNRIYPKNGWMKSVADLSDIYIGTSAKLLQAIRDNAKAQVVINGEVFPVVVNTKSGCQTIQVINGTGVSEIDEKIMQEFTKISNLKLRSKTPVKNGFVKTTTALSKVYIGDKGRIAKKLKESEGQFVEVDGQKFSVITVVSVSGQMVPCLNAVGDEKIDNAIMDKFTELSGLDLRSNTVIKSKYMRGAIDLSKHFAKDRAVIGEALDKLVGESVEIDGKILPLIIKAKAGGILTNFLNGIGNEVVDDVLFNKFKELSGLPLKTDFVEKTKDLKNAEELDAIFIGGKDKIRSFLIDYKDEFVVVNDKKVPLVVFARLDRSSMWCLNATGDKDIDKAIFDKFVEKTGLSIRKDYALKTNYMKTRDELTDYFAGRKEKITFMLRKYKKNVVEVDGKKISLIVNVKSRGNMILCLNGTGNKKTDKAIMDKFAELSGLTPRLPDVVAKMVADRIFKKK